jgi:hypothetical protein
VWHTLNSEYTVFVQGTSGDGLPQVVTRVAAGARHDPSGKIDSRRTGKSLVGVAEDDRWRQQLEERF